MRAGSFVDKIAGQIWLMNLATEEEPEILDYLNYDCLFRPRKKTRRTKRIKRRKNKVKKLELAEIIHFIDLLSN